MVVRAGKLRPSQVVTQFGPGCLVDLPELSMVLAGIDEWNTATSWTVGEPRLQRALGVRHFKKPPYLKYKEGVGGIPARIFPQFLVCPRCNRLAHHTAFEFTERGSKHLCKAGNCRGKGRAPAYPVRFMVACPNGHLDDFPWHEWVHPDIPNCDAELRLEDSGRTGSITDLWVHCPVHDRKMSLGLAFGEGGKKRLPKCRGNRPWLADTDPKECDQGLRVLLRGASNAYFAVTNSALSIPPWSDPIQVAVSAVEHNLAKVESLEHMQNFLKFGNYPELEIYDPEQVWDALRKLRGIMGDTDSADLRWEEFQAFTGSKGPADYRSEFKVVPEKVPAAVTGVLGSVVKAVRLREVRALRGFTRIDSVPDIGDMGEVDAVKAGLAPLAPTKLDWLPGVELRGEGVFLTLNSETLARWEATDAVQLYDAAHQRVQRAWYALRGVALPNVRSARFILVHSLAHMLIRRFELEAGYSGASLRERIYCDERMAGFLVYTATPDSEGTLGGLVELARPEDLGPMFQRAIEEARLCANDPLCASRRPTDQGSHMNGAACHACLLLPETSCEQGNHYLDRSLVVRTLGAEGVEFVRD
ncbi:MAG: DrmB family protein [Thermoleophilia bacterium]